MNKPTVMTAEQASEALGIDPYDLDQILRQAAADKLEEAAGDVRRGHGMDKVAQARRLLRAADAVHQAWLDVEKARTA